MSWPHLIAWIAELVPGTVTQQLQAYGQLQTMELTDHREPKGGRIYRYRFTYEHETVTVNCVYNPAGKIAGISFQPE